MKITIHVFTYFLASLLLISLAGCATYRTISTAELGSAKVFSGSRLDIGAMCGEVESTRQFKTAPPLYPVIDLPFSVAMDIFLLPLTIPAALYEFLFK